MKKIALISHGCAKNLVDSELILGILSQNGYEITLNEDETDTVIINTCSFICDAERESIHSILEMADKGKKIIVTGCLSQKTDGNTELTLITCTPDSERRIIVKAIKE